MQTDRTVDTYKSEEENPSFIQQEFPLDWSMSRSEQYALIFLLQKIKPEVSIEIGTFNGGSLQVISKYSKKVYAIDYEPSIVEKLMGKFDNVEFLIGDSKKILPELIQKIIKNSETLEFALIDGDHSHEGVLTDITNMLNYQPKTNLHIILHDSFNPICRSGMKAYVYDKNPYVHGVELDYISGIYEPDGLKRQMWGGFALIFLRKEKRVRELIVKESSRSQFETVYLHSIHFVKKSFLFLKPVYRIFTK